MASRDETELTRTRRPSGDPTAPEAAPRTWGQFQLLQELGSGAFGRVYHAWDPTLARDIALKIVHLPDATRAAVALQEGRLLARVRHRNVVTVYGAQQLDEDVGVWMELIRGRHLAQLVREQGPMGADEATVVGISVCQAIAAVHAAGLLHRDIKANNVMRESGGRIVVMDFGAGRESAPAGDVDDFAGTPVYMAPEVLNGGAASSVSDLYSVGVLLYFVVTGEYPVDGQSVLELSLAHRRGKRRLLSDRRPDLPDGFVRVVERALSYSPLDRPSSAGVMLRELANALPGSQPWTAPHDAVVEPGGLSTPASDRPPIALLPASVPSNAARPQVLPWLLGAAGALLLVGLFGVLTSMAFNVSLGRDADFATESLADWWMFGARALVWPVVLSMVVVIASRLLMTGWRALLHIIPGLRRVVRRVSRGLGGAVERLGATGPVAGSQWLLIVQVIALAAVWVTFFPLIETTMYPRDVDRSHLALLASNSNEPLYYQSAAALLVLGMGLGWYRLLSQPGAPAAVHRTTMIAGAAVLAIAVLMLVVPYRLLYHNEMPKVMLDDERCYELGKNAGRVLLYCPDRQPPQRVTTAAEHLAVATGITENIFSPASDAGR